MSCHHSFTLSHTNIIGKYIPEQIAEANQKIEDMQRLGILVDSISGALYSPADNALGTVANTLSPAIVYEIGQHFKEEGTEGSAAHILAQTLVAAATASLAGNDALTAGLSAGGGELVAPGLSWILYGTTDTKELTSEQKQTISAIISLGSATIGATTGETTDIISSSVAGTVAVEDNGYTKLQAMKKLTDAQKECINSGRSAKECANIGIVNPTNTPNGWKVTYDMEKYNITHNSEEIFGTISDISSAVGDGLDLSRYSPPKVGGVVSAISDISSLASSENLRDFGKNTSAIIVGGFSGFVGNLYGGPVGGVSAATVGAEISNNVYDRNIDSIYADMPDIPKNPNIEPQYREPLRFENE